MQVRQSSKIYYKENVISFFSIRNHEQAYSRLLRRVVCSLISQGLLQLWNDAIPRHWGRRLGRNGRVGRIGGIWQWRVHGILLHA